MLQPIVTKSAPKLNLPMIVVSFVLIILAVVWLRTIPINQSLPIVSSTNSVVTAKRAPASRLYPASVNTSSEVACMPRVNTDLVVLIVRGSRLNPDCQIVASNQSLEVNNLGKMNISGSLANKHFRVDPGKNYINHLTFGQYLATGVHFININGVGSVKLWLK